MLTKNEKLKNIQAFHIENAMKDAELLGIENFRKSLSSKFNPSISVHMYKGSRGPFESRPLVSSAYRYANNGEILIPIDFESVEAQQYLLKVWGFTKMSKI